MSGSQAEYEAASMVGARLGGTRALAVTTASQNVDLATLTEFTTQGTTGYLIKQGRMLRLRADGADVYFAFGIDGSGSIDETNTTASTATQCDYIPAGQYVDVRPPMSLPVAGALPGGRCTFLYYKGSAACKLRVTVCSEFTDDYAK